MDYNVWRQTFRADDDMGTIGEGIKDAVGSVFCASAKGATGIGRLLASLPIETEAIQTQIDRYRAFACGDDPMDSPPVGSPPLFTGGQCEDAAYRIDFRYDVIHRTNGTVASSAPNSINAAFSPIDGYRFVPLDGFPELVDGQLEFTSRGRVAGVTQLGNVAFKFKELTQVAIVRTDGQPDDCGDPPLIPPEPIEEVEDELDIVYDDPFGNPVTIPDVPIKFFKPCINLDGVRVPFELDTPFGKICGKVGISPDFPDIIEPSIDIDLCPEQREDLGYKEEQIKDFFEFLPALGAPVNFPETDLAGTLSSNWNVDAPPILGAFIRARKTQVQGGGKTIILNEPNSSAPNIVVPRLGTIFFEYLIKKEDGYDSAFSEDIPIKNVNQFIPCPWDFGATRVHFRNEIGWEFSIFPVARKSCCESCASNDPKKLDDLDRCRID